ncbi:MAG: glycosyltransferase family 39 protein [Pseudomonadota bacterium]
MASVFAPGRWLVGLVRENPIRAVLLVSGIHLTLWTFLPALMWTAMPLDVVEAYLWGREWQWGYHKHPPLAAWLQEAFLALDAGPWTAYLLGQLCVIVTFWAVWSLARPMVGGPGAAFAVLALTLNYYFTFPTTEFNPNVLQMPLWALATLHFHRALTTARWRYFLLLALWMALLIYTKYSAVILALACGVVVLATPQGRSVLKGVQLFAAAALALLLAGPHFYWIVASDYLPFAYALTQKTAPDFATRLYFPANFFAAQLACHLVLFAIAAFLWAGNRKGIPSCPEIPVGGTSKFDRTYVLIMAAAPLAISIMLCFAMGIEFLTMWGMPMFNLSGLALVVLAGRSFRLWNGAKLAALYLIFLVSLPVLIAAGQAVTPALTDRANRTMWPGAYHGWLVSNQWRRETGTPLAVVAGDIWSAGLVGLYSPDRPAVLLEGDFRRSPWIDRSALEETGLAIVWRVRGGAEPPSWVTERFPNRTDLGLFDLPGFSLPLVGSSPNPYATLGLSIVPPQPRQSASGGGSAGIASITAQ